MTQLNTTNQMIREFARVLEQPAKSVIQFKTGQVYSCRSVCDHDCIFSFEVVTRSEKTVSLKAYGKVTRRTVNVMDGVEYCMPLGRYSMARA